MSFDKHPPVVGSEVSTTAKIDLVEGMRVRRRAEKWPIYHIGANEVGCEWPRGAATIVMGGLLAELRLLAATGKLLVVGEDDDVDRLPHILWRTAKQLVSLLEKEYGFGQKRDLPSTGDALVGDGPLRQHVFASGQVVTITDEPHVVL